MDFSPGAWLRYGMDEADIELLRQIYTHIGMELVEAGDSALNLGGAQTNFDPAEIAELDRLITKVTAMLHAANAIQQ